MWMKLRQLTSLQELSCGSNKISDLEPLRQLTSLVGWVNLLSTAK